jgi:protein-disulfide isomerase
MKLLRSAATLALALLALTSPACKHADSTKTATPSAEVGAEIPPAAEATAVVAPAAAQPELPASVEAKDLDAAERKVLIEILTEQFDPCGKSRTFMDALRAGDCAIAPKLATKIIEGLRAGEGKKQILTSLLKEIERVNTVVQLDVSKAPLLGAADAKVQVVEFSDFECPFCRRAVDPIEKMQKHYGFALYFKFFPLRHSHPNAEGAARAAWAAHQQGKFWPMHDTLFANQHALDYNSVLKYAAKVGVDLKKFEADLHSDPAGAGVAADEKAGDAAGVDGTPTFFVNGHKAETMAQVEDMVREALKAAGQPVPAPLTREDLGEAAAPAADVSAAAAPAKAAEPAVAAPPAGAPAK